jgi:hypothetical protein
MTQTALVVWAFTDGKAGHENQTRGLLNALAARRALDVRWLNLPAYSSVLTSLMAKRFLPGAALPSPDLIIGAGHRTHLPMIAARRARGGKTIVLMKPSLPHVWFDLCVVPEHDAVTGVNIITTRGALNVMQPGTKQAGTGLILIGGPSRHHGWRENELLAQVEAILAREKSTHWTLTTSRRTPATTTERLRALAASNLDVVPVEQTGAGWLAAQLATAGSAWVTEDSVSMVYEALTAGCATGVLAVPLRHGGGKKIRRGLDSLVKESLVTAYAAWQTGAPLRAPARPFNEAARIAHWIDRQWLAA